MQAPRFNACSRVSVTTDRLQQFNSKARPDREQVERVQILASLGYDLRDQRGIL